MNLQAIRRPDWPDTRDMDPDRAIDRLTTALSSWVLENASDLELVDIIGAAVEEIFVPYRLTYPDILRTWLDLHADAQKSDGNDAPILFERIIEITQRGE